MEREREEKERERERKSREGVGHLHERTHARHVDQSSSRTAVTDTLTAARVRFAGEVEDVPVEDRSLARTVFVCPRSSETLPRIFAIQLFLVCRL
jgi:hypothetical protein